MSRLSTLSPGVPSFRDQLLSLSRSRRGLSKSWSPIADSFSRRTSAIFSSYSRRSARGHAPDPHPGAGLVDQVDGLSGRNRSLM